MSKIFWGGKLVKEEDGLILTLPLNEWDMNYHLYDEEEEKEYLIDIDDYEPGDDLSFVKESAFKIYDLSAD